LRSRRLLRVALSPAQVFLSLAGIYALFYFILSHAYMAVESARAQQLLCARMF
jgi:hypothetical protein